MKYVDRLGRIIALLLLVPFVSCSSAPYPVMSNVNFPQLQLLQATTGKTQQRPSTQSKPQQPQTSEQPASPYWTGDGGKGKSITILPPEGLGLADNQAYLPDLVANELVSNFNTFSAMTLFDRVSNLKQYNDLMSGIYDDKEQAGRDYGHLLSTDYMLVGGITKTSTGYALQLTVSKTEFNNKTTVAAYSGTVSIAELDNLSGVRRASLDLLQKMGVQVTALARTELTKAAATDRVDGQTAYAQGLIAQRQGNDVAALTYFFQAESFDASLAEAVSRTNVLSANISSGNIGENVRNDFAWNNDWKAKLTETETFMGDMLRKNSPQRSLWYSDKINEQESARDYTNRTTELRIEAVLHTHAAFPVSVQKTVQAVYDGLQATKRAQAWKLDSWPRQGVTNANPFNSRWGSTIPVTFEVLNGQGKVIGKQTVDMDSRFSFYGTQLDGPGTAFTTVRFTGVKGDDIDNNMAVRVAAINGQPPEKAGVSRIEQMSASLMQTNKNYTIYNGAIKPNSNNNRDLGAVTIPAELWGERVTAIADKAYENRGITSVTIPSSVTSIGTSAFAGNKLTTVTIPQGVTSIGDKAFADNHWTTQRYSDGSSTTDHHGLTSVILANSVTSIGQEAFASHWTTINSYNYTIHHWLVTEVTIGSNVTLGENAFGNGFEKFYTNIGKQAGIYKEDSWSSGGWKGSGKEGTIKQPITKNDVFYSVAPYVGLVLLLGGAALLSWLGNPDTWK